MLEIDVTESPGNVNMDGTGLQSNNRLENEQTKGSHLSFLARKEKAYLLLLELMQT